MQTETRSHSNKEKLLHNIIEMGKLTGPSGVPVLGNLLQLNTEKLHRIIESWSDQYGSIFKIKLGSIPVVVITASETIQYVLKNRPEKFKRLGRMDDVIREMGIFGVFNAEGDDWKRQRKLVSQALNINHIKSFFPALDKITEKLLDRWNRLALENSSIEIKGELMRYTVDITSKLAFGYDMNTIEKNNDIIQDHLEVIFPAIFKRINFPIPYWRFLKLPADKKLDRSLKAISKTMKNIIDETRKQLVQNKTLLDHPANFLQALLAASTLDNPISNEVIAGNVLTMLLAGEDTTAHTMAWILYFMHLNPGVQIKMQQEVDRVLANENTLKNYERAADLHYIEAVALEAMRLKPVAPVLYHETLEDVVLEGVRVPKNTAIFAQTHYAAINETHFSNAGNFIPERWMEGGCPAHKAHDDKALVPFGAGPRFCPGYNLALLEIKAVLSMLCKNFLITMETNPESVNEKLAFTMMPSDFFVRLVKRNNIQQAD